MLYSPCSIHYALFTMLYSPCSIHHARCTVTGVLQCCAAQITNFIDYSNYGFIDHSSYGFIDYSSYGSSVVAGIENFGHYIGDNLLAVFMMLHTFALTTEQALLLLSNDCHDWMCARTRMNGWHTLTHRWTDGRHTHVWMNDKFGWTDGRRKHE